MKRKPKYSKQKIQKYLTEDGWYRCPCGREYDYVNFCRHIGASRYLDGLHYRLDKELRYEEEKEAKSETIMRDGNEEEERTCCGRG
jgi:hypothetical protein